MSHIFGLLDAALYEGLPYALTALAFVVTFRYLRVPDVAAASTFVLSGAVAAYLVVHRGFGVGAAIVAAVIAGAAGGFLSGTLHVVLKIDALLSTIVSAFVLYSISLLLVQPTLPFPVAQTLFSRASDFDRTIAWLDLVWHPAQILLMLAIVSIVKFTLDRFLGSEFGLALRALEDPVGGERVLTALGISAGLLKLVGLSAANAIVGLSGALTAMKEGAANAYRGFDILITTLIIIILGERIVTTTEYVLRRRGREVHSYRIATTCAVVAAVLYFAIVYAAYQISISPQYVRIALGIAIALSIARPDQLNRRATRVTLSQVSNLRLDIRDISFAYEGQEPVIRGWSIALKAGTIALLTGPNGSGKSTFCRLIAGLHSVQDGGRIFVDGSDVTHDAGSRRKATAYVEQLTERGVVATLTVEENLRLASAPSLPRLIRGRHSHKDESIAERYLPVGRLASALSGGQRQLLNLLSVERRLSAKSIIFFDEPFNNLDTTRTADVLTLLDKLRHANKLVVVVTHDIPPAFSPDIIVAVQLSNDGFVLQTTEDDERAIANGRHANA